MAHLTLIILKEIKLFPTVSLHHGRRRLKDAGGPSSASGVVVRELGSAQPLPDAQNGCLWGSCFQELFAIPRNRLGSKEDLKVGMNFPC